jgi:hypothetical protein
MDIIITDEAKEYVKKKMDGVTITYRTAGG